MKTVYICCCGPVKYDDMLLWILLIFSPFYLRFFFLAWMTQTGIWTCETQENPVGFQNTTAFCKRDTSDLLPVDQNHSTIKMNTDPLYFSY